MTRAALVLTLVASFYASGPGPSKADSTEALQDVAGARAQPVDSRFVVTELGRIAEEIDVRKERPDVVELRSRKAALGEPGEDVLRGRPVGDEIPAEERLAKGAVDPRRSAFLRFAGLCPQGLLPGAAGPSPTREKGRAERQEGRSGDRRKRRE